MRDCVSKDSIMLSSIIDIRFFYSKDDIADLVELIEHYDYEVLETSDTRIVFTKNDSEYAASVGDTLLVTTNSEIIVTGA